MQHSPRVSRPQLLSAVAVAAFFLIWELVSATGLVRPIFISAPSRIAVAAISLFQNDFLRDIAASGSSFSVGFSLAILVGVPLGMALGWYSTMEAIARPFVAAFQATPRVALLPLLILWLGIGTQSVVAVIFLGAIFPIILNTMTGVKSADPIWLKCAASFGASTRQIFTTVLLPGSVPHIITGLRLAVGRGLLGVVVGELLASNVGVGYMMRVAGSTFQTDKLFVGLFVIAGAGVALNMVLERIETHFELWRARRT